VTGANSDPRRAADGIDEEKGLAREYSADTSTDRKSTDRKSTDRKSTDSKGPVPLRVRDAPVVPRVRPHLPYRIRARLRAVLRPS
jgi:hypothetical protein